MRGKHFFTALIICSVQMSAFSDWVLLTESESTQVFVDYRDVLRSSEHGKIEYMLNFKTPQRIKEPVFSAITEVEFDCGQRRMRNLSMQNYSAPMATGQVIFTSRKPTSWRTAPQTGMH